MEGQMLKELVELALSKGATYAEIRYQKDAYDSNLLKNGIAEVSSFDTDRGVSMRAVVNGGLGFGASSSIGRRELKGLVERTVKAARAASRLRDAPVRMGEADMAVGSSEIRVRVRPENISLEDRLAFLKEVDQAAIEAATSNAISLPGRYLNLDTFVTEKHIVNSDGADFRSVVPRAEVHAVLTAKMDSNSSVQRMFSLGEASGWEAVERWDLVRRMGEEVTILGRDPEEGR